jgi:tRNA acetyltransferase TAN1
MTRFNLMVTHEPGRENYRYVLSLLRDILGDYRLVDAATAVILLRVDDPYEAVKILKENRDRINVIYRAIPIDTVTEPYVEVVAGEAARLAEEKIPEDKTYRITLKGRLYWRETRMPAHSMDAISIIAEGIKRKVSLTSPDYVVYIRSVRLYHRRRVATITVTTPDNIFSLISSRP